MMLRHSKLILFTLGLALCVTSNPLVAADRRLQVLGISSGDVTSTSAVIWARASGESEIVVEYDLDPLFPKPVFGGAAHAGEDTDFTATVLLEELEPYTTYYYRVCLSAEIRGGEACAAHALLGRFRTAPHSSAAVPVRFIVGADVGGQRFCRHVDRGYAIFAPMRRLAPDFYIANGDGVYADLPCPAEGPSGWENIPGDFLGLADPSVDWTDRDAVREEILAHYRYNWEDRHFRAFQRSVPVYTQWDDHEVNNDFGLLWKYLNVDQIEREGFPVTAYEGLRAFFDYWPIQRNADDPQRVYRSFHWGSEVDLFLLDERSYRSRNDLPDTPENHKTMLGEEQLAWLKRGLVRSTATWKVVANTVPLSVPTAGAGGACIRFGRDGWANGDGINPPECAASGFERELLDLLRALDAHDVQNIVWLATDVHHVRSIRYRFDADGDGDELLFHEFICGPLSAVTGMPVTPLDPTLNPEPLFQAGGFFNFGYYQVETGSDGQYRFVADVRDEGGVVREGSEIILMPE